MKKLFIFLAMAGLSNFAINAQNAHCFTSEYYNEAMANDPVFAKNHADLEIFTQQYTQAHPATHHGSRQIYIIPVVFHILHNYGPENVSDDVIKHAVELMNLDYRKLNTDTIQIIPAFQSIAADCEIEFRLANIDPNGNCTNGIEHIQTMKTYAAGEGSKTDPSWMVWPNNKYLNIWTAYSLSNTGAAAYAHLPGGSNSTDGIMCWYTYADNVLHTLSHEAGHVFNLWHPWGNNNSPGQVDSNGNPICGDDSVSDTPITWGWDHCPTPNQAKKCDVNIIENYQNFMDYSYCDCMFTQGQKTRMDAALNSGVSGRNNLWTNANLIATGTDGSPVNVCIPKADFICDDAYGCANTSIHFTDQSWRGTVTNWNWEFPGGNPSTSTSSSPSVSYPLAGIYNATLTASNATGSDSITKTAVIRITANALDTVPFVEGFEDTSSFPGIDGWVSNADNGITWSRVTNAGSTGTASIKMNNYACPSGQIDEWITPSIDFSNVTASPYLRFMVSNARRNSTSDDALIIFYSLNCGQSWNTTPYSKSGATLATAGTTASNFTPTNASQWRQESVNVNPCKLKPNVRFKFQSISNHGNNLYVDDINITGTLLSIDEADDLQTGFTMYPNPTMGSTRIDFSLSKSCEVHIDVKDILGRVVTSAFQGTLGAGTHEHFLPVLSPGIYLVDLTVNNKHHIRKLVVS